MSPKRARARLLAARRIAVIRDDALGDLVLTLPMFSVLRARCPGAELHLLCRRYVAALVDGLPVIDRLHFVDEIEGGVRTALAAGGFDAVFFPRIRDVDCWSARRARIPLRVGSGYRWYSFLLSHRVWDHRSDAKFHEAEYNTRQIASVLGEPVRTELVRPRVDAGARERVGARLAAAGISPSDRLVIVHPGSGGNAREWPPECFGALAARLGADPGTRVVVTGIERERALCGAVLAAGGERVAAVSMAGALSLAEMIALVDRSALVVANSTGVLHVAAALGVPVLGLYPSAPPALSAARWGPYTKRATVLTPPIDTPGEMARITPEAAETAARALFTLPPRD